MDQEAEEFFYSHTMTREPEEFFHSPSYLAINAARMRHLESLVRPTVAPGATILEVAAGIGDLTPFWVRGGHSVTATEARPENIAAFSRRHPSVPVVQHDLESADPLPGPNEIVHAYGVLYHLGDPAHGLAQMAKACSQTLLLETCVSFGDEPQVNLVDEPAANPTQALRGLGCRPTRRWIYDQLTLHFPYVYLPLTQPDHPEFPLDWTEPGSAAHGLARSVFVASRRPVRSSALSAELLMRQTVDP